MSLYLTQEEIINVLNKVIDLFLIPRFMELNMLATAGWIANVHSQAGLNEGSIMGPDYTLQLVNGTPPGTIVPIEDLTNWARAKFGVNEDRARGIAFAVQQKIYERGTISYREGGTDLLEVLDEPRTLQFIQEELGGIVQLRVTEELQRNAQEVFS